MWYAHGHAFSAPVGYLTRPYVVYRSRDTRPGLRPARPGWEGPAHRTDAGRAGRPPMTTTVAPAGAATTTRGATRNLVLATIGFMVNFWAWALLGPLGPGVKDRLGLSFT